MKKKYFIIILVLGFCSCQKENNNTQVSDGKLYGMTIFGGSSDEGVIFSFDPSTSIYTKLLGFHGELGRRPRGSLLKARDGKLYGMTSEGGSNDIGVIFSFDPSASTYTKLVDFDDNNGRAPLGSLIQALNGKLYGMTSIGGSNNFGVIFSFDPTTSIYTKLMDFDPYWAYNGGGPEGSLIQATDGKLYGMTAGGGSNGSDVIFSFDPSALTYTKLKDFYRNDGLYAYGSLMQARDGKLYGMTESGGSNNTGVIFSFDPSALTYTKLKDFDSTNGSFPHSGLMQARDGKLYGMTGGGGSNYAGVIFSFDPFTSTYTKLMDFDYDGINGASPSGYFIQASDGKLYGTTRIGGSSHKGVIFSFDPSTSTYTKLKDFDGINGANPFVGSGLVFR